ncbi:MAG: hypothetical protein VX768_19970 [Planctomycetota bacterium]|nr:hypothetical protein [Planctomycetota bacterium]
MFGIPDYFKNSASRLPIPGRISGWVFYGLWISAILAPCLILLFMGKPLQTGIWFLFSSVWFTADTVSTSRRIRRKSEMDQLFFIGEEDSHVSTSKYDLNLRNSNPDS